MNRINALVRTLSAVLVLGALPVAAQEAAATPAAPAAAGGQLLFQLNNAQTVEGGCQLTFAIRNDTGAEIDKSSYNMAIINPDGQVSTLITFEFKPFPLGKTRFQQFSLSGQPCDSISGIAINDFSECTGKDGAALPVCEENMAESSKTSIQFPWELQ
jgi:hypothetical protein